ncbi:hypothetical protein PC129_g20924 [Phytophthora cactorum]|uniref:Uncharacterized protein n=1 Tax=Phytophthora cactorum TaxID=29920 RepID=A0A8T1H775_9STRA|nr:hypothetical protein Pcac1_g26978 [Phytophthora cactorum]KAG3208043.1 hypothetical protein PC129_g20924 [Phytophthora cactorum]KAG4225721.1 hypothetical protein PC116_g25861 [Phytophthora cactorum]
MSSPVAFAFTFTLLLIAIALSHTAATRFPPLNPRRYSSSFKFVVVIITPSEKTVRLNRSDQDTTATI